MAPSVRDERILQFESDLIPCVSIGKPDESQLVSYVDVDNFKLVQDAVSLLAVNGYKKIYLINANESLNISRDRALAFTRALDDNGLEGGEGNVFYTVESNSQEGESIANRVIEKGTAFITANVRIAEGVYAAAERAELEVGKHVGVFALGGKRNEKVTPNLTYATQDYAKLAKMASRNLLRQLKKAQDGEEIITEAALIPSKICFDTSINKK